MADATRPGGINLTVANGDACADGWTLTVDGGSPTHRNGKTAAIGDLAPDQHTVIVEGKITDAPKRAEKIVAVSAGAIAECSLTLE